MSLTVVNWFVLRNLLVIKAEFSDIDVGTMKTVEILPDRKIQGNRGWTLKQVLYMISDPDYQIVCDKSTM